MHRWAFLIAGLISAAPSCWGQAAELEVPAGASAAKPARPSPRPARTLVTEAEVGALTSEITDQYYSRLNLRGTSPGRRWFLRGGFALTKSRAYTATTVRQTQVETYRLDTQHRKDTHPNYSFLAATVNIRDRSPYTVTYGARSGYYLASAGVGKKILPGIETEIALAGFGIFGDDTDQGVTLVSSLRWQHALTDATSLSGHAYILRPFTHESLIDSRLDLSYKFNPSLSLRFSYVANNLLRPITSRTGWDKSFRVSLVFSRTIQ